MNDQEPTPQQTSKPIPRRKILETAGKAALAGGVAFGLYEVTRYIAGPIIDSTVSSLMHAGRNQNRVGRYEATFSQVSTKDRLIPQPVEVDGHKIVFGSPIEVNIPGFLYFPDGNTSVVSSADGTIELYTAVATEMERMSGPSLEKLYTANEAVLKPGQFDWNRHYSGPGTVFTLAGRNAQDRFCVFHAEQWGRDNDGSNFRATVGLATSNDAGKSWRMVTEPIIRGMQELEPGNPKRVSGAGQPSAYVDENSGFIYVFYTDWNGTFPDAIHVARAPIADFQNRKAWQKWHKQLGFASPADGGESTPVILPGVGESYAALGAISFNQVLGKPMITCETGSNFSVTVADNPADLTKWRPTQPLVVFPQTRVQEQSMARAVWYSYPSLTGLRSSMQTGSENFLHYSRGVRANGWQPIEPHRMVRQKLTII